MTRVADYELLNNDTLDIPAAQWTNTLPFLRPKIIYIRNSYYF